MIFSSYEVLDAARNYSSNLFEVTNWLNIPLDKHPNTIEEAEVLSNRIDEAFRERFDSMIQEQNLVTGFKWLCSYLGLAKENRTLWGMLFEISRKNNQRNRVKDRPQFSTSVTC